MSFRGLAPLLAPHHRLLIPDLPGHGFTRPVRRGRMGIDGIAGDLAALCAREGWSPVAAVGHSAGGVLALRLAEMLPLRAVATINASLGHFDGAAGVLFPAMARLLALTPFVPHLFAWANGNDRQVGALLAAVGSPLDAEGRALYRSLVARPEHVAGALAMMAEWRLDPLLARLDRISVPALLLTAGRDGAVPPAVSARAAARMPQARHLDLPGHGHLVHEEAPAAVAAELLPFLAAACAAG
jgi:magnesium chelatase accessory protein